VAAALIYTLSLHDALPISYNKAFQTTIQKAATVALTDVPLLICGESGTGKNALAHYLHQCSRRRDKPLVVVNCAAVPADMMESRSEEHTSELQSRFDLVCR